MASDSRGTDEYEMHLTECQKLYKLDSGAILGTAGDDDIRGLLRLLAPAKGPSELPTKKRLAKTKTDFKGIIAFPSGEVYIIVVEPPREEWDDWAGYVCEIKDQICAVGSGAQFAYGAMEAGKTASEAVEIACKRDVLSALPVQVLKLEQ